MNVDYSIRCASLLHHLLFATLLAALIPLGGCERKEKVLEVDTPAADVDVERSKDTGEVTIEVDDN